MSGITVDTKSQQGPGSESDACEARSRPPQSEHKGERREKEVGGRPGPEPTRYGDWENKGHCIDF